MIIDQDIRDEIIESDHKHYLISASAGSGKTTILVEKAFSMLDRNIIKPYQQIAMITFTRLATRQIRDKVNEQISKRYNDVNYLKAIKIITTESFILSEVIKPFIRDAYGKNFPSGDELMQNYNCKFRDYEDGLLYIKSNKLIGSYRANNKNFTYQLGLQILIRSANARKYIKAMYPIVMIDEYQDVDYDMHQLYMYLKNVLNIRLVIVGDIKQMLYQFRGANIEIMNNLEKDHDIRKYSLIQNFRSHLSIVNYSYQFFKQEIVIPKIPYEEDRIRFYSSSDSVEENINRFICEVSSQIDDTFAFIFARRDQWIKEKRLWEDEGFIFIDNPPLDSSYPNYNLLEPVLKLYFDLGNYNIYNMLDDLELEIKSSTVRKANLILDNLDRNNMEALKIIEELSGKYLLDEEKQRFEETLHEQYRVNFVVDRPKKVALTIHGSKGLEFDHVFIHADSFFYYDDFKRQNHYVAITRPKKSLHIINTGRYESILHAHGIVVQGNKVN